MRFYFNILIDSSIMRIVYLILVCTHYLSQCVQHRSDSAILHLVMSSPRALILAQVVHTPCAIHHGLLCIATT